MTTSPKSYLPVTQYCMFHADEWTSFNAETDNRVVVQLFRTICLPVLSVSTQRQVQQ